MPPAVPQTRKEAEEADRLDPLAQYRSYFHLSGGGAIYLDGNSLGRQTTATAGAMREALDQWREQLVGGWDHWAELPKLVGDRIGTLIGATAGQVVVSDSTTVNLYKLGVAALDAQVDRRVIVGDANDFPTVRYVLQGLAARENCRLRLLSAAPSEGLSVDAVSSALDDDVALVCFSAVNYRSGAVMDLREVTEAAHRFGSLVLWDLSHAAGALPLALDEQGADLAVGCGYKYLNGGPGAPAFLYVSSRLHGLLRQPIWGWWGQADQFAMAEDYEPVGGVGQFLTGTPAVLGLVALDAGIGPLMAVGVPSLWEKGRRLVALLAARASARLAPLQATIASPADPDKRGAHLAIAHPHAWAATRLLIDHRLVVPDFRAPNIMRLAPVPIYTQFVEVWDAVEHIAAVLDGPAAHFDPPRKGVT